MFVHFLEHVSNFDQEIFRTSQEKLKNLVKLPIEFDHLCGSCRSATSDCVNFNMR